jgi:hypothetical protein
MARRNVPLVMDGIFPVVISGIRFNPFEAGAVERGFKVHSL